MGREVNMIRSGEEVLAAVCRRVGNVDNTIFFPAGVDEGPEVR